MKSENMKCNRHRLTSKLIVSQAFSKAVKISKMLLLSATLLLGSMAYSTLVLADQSDCEATKTCDKSLHGLASFRVGNVINLGQLRNAPEIHVDKYSRHFNRFTPESATNPQNVEKAMAGSAWHIQQLQAIADYANGKVADLGEGGVRRFVQRDDKVPIHMHTLLYSNVWVQDLFLPQWVKDWDPSAPGNDQAAFLARLEKWVVDYVQYLLDFGMPIESIEVTNELVDVISGLPGYAYDMSILGTPEANKPNKFRLYGGEDYYMNAYRALRKAFPEIKLVYNSYFTSEEGAYLLGAWMLGVIPYRADTELAVIDKLLAENLVDVVGMQMHLAGWFRGPAKLPTIPFVRNLFEKLVARNVQIFLSEVTLEITDEIPIDTYFIPEDRAQHQAEYMKEVIDAYLEIVPQRLQYGISFWGIEDTTMYVNWGLNGRESGQLPSFDFPGLWTKDISTTPITYVAKPVLFSFAKSICMKGGRSCKNKEGAAKETCLAQLEAKCEEKAAHVDDDI